MVEKPKEVKGQIAVSQLDRSRHIKEEFKGEVPLNPIRFPKELGEEHPFPFQDAEKLAKRYGLVSEIVEKIATSIIGQFSIKTQNKNSQALLDSFINDTNFLPVVTRWIKEAILKGNGFLEVDFEDTKNPQMRTINANGMFVRRNKKGKILAYNQFTRDLQKFVVRNEKDIVQFKPDQIAHLKVNDSPGEAYGVGLIWPNERVIDQLINNEINLHQVIERKAGSPYHVKVGQEGMSARSEDIQNFSNDLQFMQNKTEWVTDQFVDINTVQIDGLGDAHIQALKYDFEQLAAGVGIPVVLFGSGQLNEGIAKVQLATFQDKIRSLQELVEVELEEKVFKPLLLVNKLDEAVDFIWNLPGEAEINERLDRIQKILNTFTISENLRRSLELETARLLNLEKAEEFLPEPEAGLEQEVLPDNYRT